MTIKTSKIKIKTFFSSFFGIFSKKYVYGAIAGFLICLVFCFFLPGQALAQAQFSDVSIMSPLEGESFSSPMPKILGILNGAEDQEVQVFIDGFLNGVAKPKSGKFEYYPFLPLSSGSHFISAKIASRGGGIENISDSVSIYIIPNPAPIILYPAQGEDFGVDRAWVGGVAKNDSTVIVYIDGKEVARTKVKNHESGSASFGVEIKDQSQGWHTIHAIARDKQGKDSFSSEIIAANFADPTPAPILMRPVVNSNSGIERPFIVGLAKNNLEVSIIVDGKIANTINVGAHPSGTASFSWQLDFDLSLGTHKIEALASDSGKLSNNSKPFYWQVGYVDVSYSGEDKRDNKVSKEESSQNVVIIDDKSRQEGSVSISDKQDPAHLTVKDNLSQSPESPVVPDVGAIFEEEERGRVMTEDDGVLGEIAGPGLSQDGEEYQDDIVEIGPGAVVRVEDLQKQDGKFSINTSFVAGVVILAFLLLSIFVWYIQERKDELSDKVVSIFKEEDEESKDGAFGGDKDSSGEIKISREDSSKQSSPEKEDWAPDFDRNDDFGPEKEDSSDEVMNERYPDDFPPPPPPMF